MRCTLTISQVETNCFVCLFVCFFGVSLPLTRRIGKIQQASGIQIFILSLRAKKKHITLENYLIGYIDTNFNACIKVGIHVTAEMILQHGNFYYGVPWKLSFIQFSLRQYIKDKINICILDARWILTIRPYQIVSAFIQLSLIISMFITFI